MWIKINIIKSEKKGIYFPHFFAISQSNINIIFGGKKIKTKINNYDNYEPQAGFTRERPINVNMTSKLQEKLLIPEPLIYQLKVGNNYLEIGPVIAFWVGDHQYKTSHITKYTDRFGVSKNIGGLIFVFAPRSIDFAKENVTGLYYNTEKSKWKYTKLPFPSFIYRRNFSATSPETIAKLKKITDNNIYNSYRFSKMELYNILSQNDWFKQFLPLTKPVDNFTQIIEFMQINPRSILKPISSSRGRGIIVIEKINSNNFNLVMPEKSYVVDKKKLYEILEENNIFLQNYLMQKHIALASINDSVFDIRVVMQKLKPQRWLCSGIEIRKAKKGQYLTNISQGGTALSFTEGLKNVFTTTQECQQMRNKILNLVQKMCDILDNTGENYHEFGIDIALDKNYKLWFLEANVLPSFKGFKEINYNNYLFIRYNPLRFAACKTEFEVDNSLSSTPPTLLI